MINSTDFIGLVALQSQDLLGSRYMIISNRELFDFITEPVSGESNGQSIRMDIPHMDMNIGVNPNHANDDKATWVSSCFFSTHCSSNNKELGNYLTHVGDKAFNRRYYELAAEKVPRDNPDFHNKFSQMYDQIFHRVTNELMEEYGITMSNVYMGHIYTGELVAPKYDDLQKIDIRSN